MDDLNSNAVIGNIGAGFRSLKANVQRRFSVGKPGLVPEDEPDEIDSVSVVKGQLPAVVKAQQTRSLPNTNPTHEKDVIDAIDKVYYTDDAAFDAGRYEIDNLPATLDVNELNGRRRKLREQLSVVSKKVSTIILENNPSYAAELEKVRHVQSMLNQVCISCAAVRRKLGEAQKSTSGDGLRLLADQVKIRQLGRVLGAMKTIKTLHETDFRLRELLEDGNFPAAILLCKEGQKAAQTYSCFACIGELSCKLSDTLGQVEARLDNALAAVPLHFDPDRYGRLYAGYELIGKTEAASAKLVSFFNAALQCSARSVVTEQASVSATTKVDTMSYEEVCQLVSSEKLVPCFQDLGLVLCNILATYHSVLRFHIEEDERKACGSQSEPDFVGVVQQKLKQSLYAVCQTASEKMAILLGRHEFVGFKFDRFLQAVDYSKRFEQFGLRYFGNGCEQISRVVEEHTIVYFQHYHKERLDELRMFVETEGWALCPVPKSFTVNDLPEFSFLSGAEDIRHFSSQKDQSDDGLVAEMAYASAEFELIAVDQSNPFETATKGAASTAADSSAEDLISNGFDESDDEPEELKREILEDGENDGLRDVSKAVAIRPNSALAPVMCNTALNLLRFCGRYLHMSHLLRAIASEAVVALTELFDYYLCSICSLFGSDVGEIPVQFCTPKLSSVLNRITSTLFSTATPKAIPSRSCSVPLNNVDGLFGLAERTIGVESLQFVAVQLYQLKGVMESQLPEAKKPFVSQFFNQTVDTAVDVRRLVYGCVASKSLSYGAILSQVVACKWDINELMSQHNGYVDFIIEEFCLFRERLAHVTDHVPVCQESYTLLMDAIVLCVCVTLVQGYAEPDKRCSNEGRALMQLDFEQLAMKLEEMVDLRPIPHRSYVESYVKAYYLPETALEEWVGQHREYTNRQLITLITVCTHVSRKTRSRIVAALEGREIS